MPGHFPNLLIKISLFLSVIKKKTTTVILRGHKFNIHLPEGRCILKVFMLGSFCIFEDFSTLERFEI